MVGRFDAALASLRPKFIEMLSDIQCLRRVLDCAW